MVCENGQSEIAEMLIQKSAELNIDLNAKHRLFDRTAFHLAYESGHYIKLLIFSSVDNYCSKTYSFSKRCYFIKGFVFSKDFQHLSK